MNDLTALQRDTLVILNGIEEPSGIEIQDELNRYYDGEIFGGRLYPSLDGLVDQGLIRKESSDGRTNAYLLTDDGEQLLEERFEWVERQLDGIELESEDA